MKVYVLPAGPLETNCCLLTDESTGLCAVTDPGGEGLAEEIAARGLTPCAILLTHGHWDHVGGIDGLLARWPALPVYLHPLDLAGAGGETHYHYPGAGANQRTYDDGDTVPVGSLTVRVLHTPGHTKGSVVLLCGDVMLAGDTLFAGSCGRCDLPGGDLGEMFASLKRLALLEGDYKVYPGHGGGTTLQTERETNPYMRRAMQR